MAGTTWADVKSYAEEVIPIIRKNTKDALIIVGTPTWSQDVDIAAEDPVTGYDNIMYAVHFYAATHTDNVLFTALWGFLFLDQIPDYLSVIGYVVIIGTSVVKWYITIERPHRQEIHREHELNDR